MALDAARELREALGAPFERARAMRESACTSPEFLALEVERIFARDWVRASRPRAPGDDLTLEVAGEPAVVLRDREGRVRARPNVCRHRMSTLLRGEGCARAIVCPCHAWTHGLDGRLHGAPGMALNEGFDRSAIRLPPVRCEVWEGWIMLSPSADAPPLAEALADLAPMIGAYGMGDDVERFHERFSWATNWKVLAETFMEGCHLTVCHAGTIGGEGRLEEMGCPPGFPAFAVHSILKDASVPLALAHPLSNRLPGDDRRRTWLISVHPSLFIPLTPGCFWYHSPTPKAPGGVDVPFGGGLSPEWLADPGAEAHMANLRALLDAVSAEDKGCVEGVRRGHTSRLGAPGPLSHLERPNWDVAGYILSRVEA